ncbi:MAG TPA: class I SAM-dependent methyltransferase [Pricia antarctica]|uniref:Class I SAM-dependent methyltransferase n=2 Tax=root TaxID=1 RepID=A0A831VM34_9FLAO|nr:class I SAM-dependent methyltransferase [Pricia antarctica]
MDDARQGNAVNHNRSVRQIMETIYMQKEWGGVKQEFYSGQGSHLPKIVDPYVRKINQFLNAFTPKLRVCDLGCGDFNVGKQLVKASVQYIGVDIVADLIVRNKTLFKRPNLEFMTLDIISDDLPEADCVLVRQVLQHLSNEQIGFIIKKLKKFKYMIVTEHLPKGDFVANMDKKTDASIRLFENSGVVLTESPFDLSPLKQRSLIQIHLKKGQIETTLYQNF